MKESRIRERSFGDKSLSPMSRIVAQAVPVLRAVMILEGTSLLLRRTRVKSNLTQRGIVMVTRRGRGAQIGRSILLT